MEVPIGRSASPPPVEQGERGRPPAPGLPSSLRHDTWFALHRAEHAVSRALLDAAQPMGLDPRHYLVLTALADLGPVTQQQLTATLGIDRTSIVHVIDTLEQRALAERRRSPTDRRAYAVSITAAGARQLDQLRAALHRAQDAAFEALGPDDRAELTALLGRVLRRP